MSETNYLNADGSVNTDEISSFEPIPDGKYLCVLTGIETKEPETPEKGQQLRATWQITRGDQVDRKIVLTYDFTVYPPKPETLAKNRNAKAAIFGVTRLLEDFAASGKPLDKSKERIYIGEDNVIKTAQLYRNRFSELPCYVLLSTKVSRKKDDIDPQTGEQKRFQERKIIEAAEKPVSSVELKSSKKGKGEDFL